MAKTTEKVAKNKEVFKAPIDGKEVELAVIKPNAKTFLGGQGAFNQTYSRLISQENTVLEATLEKVLKEQGAWNDEVQEEAEKLRKAINDAELRLAEGGFDIEEAKELAVQMRRDRAAWRQLLSKRFQIQQNTAEAQAENARFNYLVQQCLVYNDTGEKVYATLDEYYERGDEEAALIGAIKFGALTNQFAEDSELKLPENKFLQEFGFCDDELRLINEDGDYVDTEGRIIDEEGYYLDADGKRVDENGVPLDEDGNFAVERKPFTGKDGKPIISPLADKSKTKTKAPAAKKKVLTAKAEAEVDTNTDTDK
jgi:glucan-binding YG repeat protein